MSEQLLPPNVTLANEAYVHYCVGLTIVQSPERLVEVHNRPEIEAHADEILGSAERIMVDGVRRFIKASLPPRIATFKQASSLYEEVEPEMYKRLASAIVYNEKRLYDLNAKIKIVRPQPFMDEGLFKYITHSNYRKIDTIDMLDGFMWSPVFDELIHGRKLTGMRKTESGLHAV